MSNIEIINILGCHAILSNGRLEVSVPNEDIGSKIVMKVADTILNGNGNISILLLRLPNKEVYITASDKENLLFRAEERVSN